MKIDTIHIDGFGQFHQLPIKNLPAGLTIFKGANEAGKSTILSFIRRMLFGFPSGRTSCNFYPPFEGGNHGGRLVITTDSGERCVIERYATKGNDIKITLKDGSIGGITDLQKVLGYADQTIFENIYAFGLDELQRFETLKSDAINSKLYSAGTGIGTISISEVQNSLKKRESDLYKKQGSKPSINSLFKQIKEINKKINELEEDQKKYDSFNFEMERLSKAIDNLKGEHSEIQKNLNHILDLISIWDDWGNLQDARISLENLPKIEIFPEKGVDNLDRIQEKMEEFTNTISLLQEELEKNGIEQKDIHIDQDLLRQRDEVLNLGNGIEKYRSERKLIPELERKLHKENSDLLELFRDLGPGWNDDKLNNFDRSIPANETVIQKRKAIDDIENIIKETQNELKQIRRDIERINGEIDDIGNKLSPNTVEMNNEDVNRALEAIRYLRIKYPLLKEKESELKNIQKEEALFTTIQPKTLRQPIWPAGIIILAGIIGLVYGYLINNIIPGVIIFIILLVIAVIYIFSIRKRGLESDEDLVDGTHIKKTQNFSDLIEQAKSEKDAIRVEMLTYSRLCGFNDIPDPILLEKKGTELESITNDLRIIEELKGQREKLSNELGKLNDQCKSLENRLKTEKAEKDRIFNEWKDWLSKYDLDPTFSPESILKIFSTIRTCYDKQNTIYDLESQLDLNREYIRDYEEKIMSVLKRCNRSASGISYDRELEKIREDMDRALHNAERLNQSSTDSKKITIGLQSAGAKYQTLEKELLNLLASGSSKTVEEFYKNAKIWNERVQLQNKIQKAENQIMRIFGNRKRYDDLIIELENIDYPGLKEKEKDLKDRLTSLNNEISNNTDKRGAIRNQIEQLEHCHEGSMLRMEVGVLAEDLNKKSRDWAILVLAQEILTKAIEVYEKERQPSVIIEAQSFFSKITNNRYKRIYSPLNSSEIYIEDYDGRQKNILQLSKGTTEQLYLALRFGFIKEFGKHSESLPIVFDDILVNFDPTRSRNAGEAIMELAATNQILYFTCHPETEKMLTNLAPDAQVIDLDNYITT